MHVALAIGSNIGDRLAHLQFAVDQLSAHMQITAISPVYSTDPVGGPEQDDFLNAVLIGETEIDPQSLLSTCHEIEAAAHRERIEHWGPRTLDVDLLAVNDQAITTDSLTVPHPRAHERGFVLVPWKDIDPEFHLVGHGKIGDLVSQVDVSGVRRAPEFTLTMPQWGSDEH